ARYPSRSTTLNLTHSAWPSRIHCAGRPRPPSRSLPWLTCVSSWAKSDARPTRFIWGRESPRRKRPTPRALPGFEVPSAHRPLVAVAVALSSWGERQSEPVEHQPRDQVDDLVVARA